MAVTPKRLSSFRHESPSLFYVSPPSGPFLLLREDGTRILREDGTDLLLE